MPREYRHIKMYEKEIFELKEQGLSQRQIAEKLGFSYKKMHYFFRKEVRTSVKYMAIYRHKDKYSISEMCRFFKVSRSGYYDYVKRMDIPAWDLPLAEKIQECQEQCGKTYRYRRVHIWLERNGIYRNPKTILRVMQKYCLLSVIRDLYDNSIVAYKTGTEQNINLVLSTIREAEKKEKVTAELQLHSDQGFQYTSHGYFKLTQEYNITPSMSRRDGFDSRYLRRVHPFLQQPKNTTENKTDSTRIEKSVLLLKIKS